VRKVSTRLADGRELLYYDAGGAPPRVARDTRDLPPYAPRVEVRRDPLLDEPVVVASHRQERTFLPTADDCPLCPSAPDRPTEIPEYDYEVAVFENRFPSFTAGTRGRCEVVCFTSRHDGRFADLPVRRARLVVDVWADRTEALAALPGVEQVFCFENRGEEIGVTLHHPHGQIYAYPFVTPTTLRQLETAEAHRAATGRDLFADVLAREREAGIRVLAETSHWTAFVPASARWPFEVHLYPHRAVPDLPALDDEERDELAAVYLDLLRALDALFGVSLPYVAAWHQAPTRERRGLARLHLQLFSVRRAPGKLKYLAGSEAAMGVWVNDVVPEDAAALLRAALQSSRAPSEAAQIQARPREP
jgi:UDPglucose--hexose-1-phosphate uridylyltransferase